MLLHDDTPGVVNLVLNLMSGLVQDLGEAAPGSGRGEAREHQDLWRGITRTRARRRGEVTRSGSGTSTRTWTRRGKPAQDLRRGDEARQHQDPGEETRSGSWRGIRARGVDG